MPDFNLNINLSSAEASSGGDDDRLSRDEAEIERLNEARARFEEYIGNKDAEEAAKKAASAERSAQAKALAAEKAKMKEKKSLEALTGAAITTGLMTGAKYISWRQSSIYQDQAAANAIDNAISVPAAGLAVAGTVKAAAAAGAAAGPAGAVIVAALAVLAAVTKIATNMQDWEFNRDKNMANEIRSSDRLGIVIANRNRSAK
jgi:hypothetical protein